VSAVSISRCNAMDTAGCRTEAPSVQAHEATISADPATGTIYASNTSRPQIDVLNVATCHLGNLTGCAPAAEIPVAHPMASVSAVDETTHTLYAADPAAGTVAVINTGTCNAHDTAGCAQHPPVIKIGASPNTPVVNPATRTLYVSYGSNADRVAVVNAATCNATRTSGCGQTPAVVKVGAGTAIMAVSTATNTIYAPNSGTSSFNGQTMSVINGATCNGTSTAGCGRRFPTMATGVAPLLAAVDAATGSIYVTDFGNAGVTVLDGSRCNATVTSGCGAPSREHAVGSERLAWPLTRTPARST
jgi:DNA-binding beta-propeller fold protein YncE